MGEMKIQENLFQDKHTGEFIVYFDLKDINLKYAALSKVEGILTHVLLFLIRSIVNPLKFSLPNFTTTGATAKQMFPLLWKAFGTCKMNILKGLAAKCEGASQIENYLTCILI